MDGNKKPFKYADSNIGFRNKTVGKNSSDAERRGIDPSAPIK